MWYAQIDVSWISHIFIYKWLFTWLFVCCCCNQCFMIGVNVWWVYLAPQHISSAIVLTLGNISCIINKDRPPGQTPVAVMNTLTDLERGGWQSLRDCCRVRQKKQNTHTHINGKVDAVFVCFVFVLGTRVSYLRHIGFFLFFLFLSSTPLFPLHFHVFLFFKFILILSSTNSTVQSDVKVSRFFTLSLSLSLSLSLCCCWVFCLLVFRFCALLSLTLMNYMTTTSFFYSTSEISGKTTINTKNTTLYKQKTKKRKKERKKGMLSGKPQNVFCSFIKNILSSNEGDNQTLGFKMEESLRESPNTRLFSSGYSPG